jgi:uncharacterized membrane protein
MNSIAKLRSCRRPHSNEPRLAGLRCERLSLSVVSFPLLLDRHVGVTAAAYTSVRAVLKNPMAMALWGLIVAFALVIGSLPLFVGLAVVMPVL